MGSRVGEALAGRGEPYVVIEDSDRLVARLCETGVEAIMGNAVKSDVQPALTIIARAHSDGDVDHLVAAGADAVIMGEHEVARGMIARVFPV